LRAVIFSAISAATRLLLPFVGWEDRPYMQSQAAQIVKAREHYLKNISSLTNVAPTDRTAESAARYLRDWIVEAGLVKSF